MRNQGDFKFIANDKFKKETQDKGGKDVMSCKFCDKKHVRSREECPAWGKTSNKCGEKNHFAVKCTKSSKASKSSKPSKKKKKRKPVHTIQEDSSSEEYLLTVSVESLESVNSQKLYAKMVVNGHGIQFQLDCGATLNVLPVREYKKVCDDPELKELKASKVILSMYNGTGICPLGKRKISLRNPKINRK